jgi:hypothetical protein
MSLVVADHGDLPNQYWLLTSHGGTRIEEAFQGEILNTGHAGSVL